MTIATVLLCGFGAFGPHHANAWRTLDKTVLVAEPNGQARAQAQALGIAEADIAPTAADLLQRADCLDIVTPPATHLDLCEIALAAGKPVLLEKPAVVNVQEAERLLTIQKANGQHVQVNLLLRAHAMTKRCMALLGQGTIGSLVLMEGRFRGWKRQHRSIGLLQNDGVHFLDLMRLFSGSPISRVATRALSFLGHDKPDDIAMALTHANGIESRLSLGVMVPGAGQDAFVPGAQTDKVLLLVGDQGSLTLDFNTNVLTLQSVNYKVDTATVNAVPGTVHREEFGDATPSTLLLESFKTFLANCERGAPVLVPLKQGALELARVIDAVSASTLRAPVGDLSIRQVAS